MPAYHPQRIEPKWQAEWERNKTFRAIDLDRSRPKLYVLDMFPYPSGAGLHVGHPEGYTATDIVCRYKRMRGYNVLHPMGWDAFGLPAEQYAVQTNTHPRITTQANINTFRRQIKSLGFSYDWDREVDTTDPDYYRWTQWIFLQLYDTWYDPDHEWTDPTGRKRKGKGRPIAELPIPGDTRDPDAYRDSRRLAYRALVPVNWCPELGTVLANEEVIDGKSERGAFPVVRMPLTQWMLRITAYAERLIEDLDELDWSRSIKDMQRNWVGRSEGALVDFPVRCQDGTDTIKVYTTRPDTLFGATYMVLAPEHPLVDLVTDPEHRPGVEAYRAAAASKSDLDRTDLTKAKTGVFTGAHATNPVNGQQIPVWVADYVLMGYGTGAIMAVPGHDERDFEFAEAFDLPIVRVVAPSIDQADAPLSEAEPEPGISVHSRNDTITLDGLPTAEAKDAITGWLAKQGLGTKTVNYKLRDWLFSRQRYWGEPFPIVFDEHDRARAARCIRPAGPAAGSRGLQAHGQARAAALEGRRLGSLLRQGSARDEHDAPVGGIVLVLFAVHRPPQPQAAVGAREGTVLDARGSLHRGSGARRLAPALQPVLAQGVVRPRLGQHARAFPQAGQPGDDPG